MKEYKGTIFVLHFNVMNLVHEAPTKATSLYSSLLDH